MVSSSAGEWLLLEACTASSSPAAAAAEGCAGASGDVEEDVGVDAGGMDEGEGRTDEADEACPPGNRADGSTKALGCNPPLRKVWQANQYVCPEEHA